jgi:hypothetical protein
MPSNCLQFLLTNFILKSECIIGFLSNISRWQVPKGVDGPAVQPIGETSY